MCWTQIIDWGPEFQFSVLLCKRCCLFAASSDMVLCSSGPSSLWKSDVIFVVQVRVGDSRIRSRGRIKVAVNTSGDFYVGLRVDTKSHISHKRPGSSVSPPSPLTRLYTNYGFGLRGGLKCSVFVIVASGAEKASRRAMSRNVGC